MSTYFIGDVHGCYDELQRLLARINFNENSDRLIFVGDLINRGPRSLAVLHFIKSLGDGAEVVLGNHDISLLAYGLGVYHGRHSNFPEILVNEDAHSLLAWLRQKPLLLYLPEMNVYVVHAGIPPIWSLKKARKQAAKAEKKLRSKKWAKYLEYAYANKPDKWQSDFDKFDKFRYRLNGFARLRFCDRFGEPELNEKCSVGNQSQGLYPWFEQRLKMQDDGDARIIFGHWAALGYRQMGNIVCIDSGCVWGGQLTAIELTEKGVVKTQVSAA